MSILKQFVLKQFVLKQFVPQHTLKRAVHFCAVSVGAAALSYTTVALTACSTTSGAEVANTEGKDMHKHGEHAHKEHKDGEKCACKHDGEHAGEHGKEHGKEHGEHAHQHGDGHMHKRFENAEAWAKTFDDPARDAWQKPEQVIAWLNLDSKALVADVGAGTGYFSSRLAKSYPEATVYAADIEADMVRYLGDRAKNESLKNLVPTQASAVGTGLNSPVDVVLMVDTYHHIENRSTYFAGVRGQLKTGGRVAIVDFKMDSPVGPPAKHRISPSQMDQEMQEAGFIRAAFHDDLPYQYMIIYQIKP